jgi:hypothetical protein
VAAGSGKASVIALAIWWVALLLLWFALAGTLSTAEAIVGVAAALAGTAAVEAVRRQGGPRLRPRARWLRHAGAVPVRVVADFGRVVAALALRLRGRTERGRFRAIPFPVGGGDGRSTARRALAAAGGSIAANGYVVGFDSSDNLVLVHELRPRKGRSPIPGHHL